MIGARATTGCVEIAVLTGLHAGARLLLNGHSHTVIGRDLACDLTLRDTSVAPRHLMLVARDGKIRAIGLDGEIEVGGWLVPEGKERVLRTGEQIKLGEVAIGLGEQGANWDHAADVVRAAAGVGRLGKQLDHWLAQSDRRRRGAVVSIVAGAGLCVVLPFAVALAQWSKRHEIAAPDEATLIRQIEQRFVAAKLHGLRVSVDPATHSIMVDGYVPIDEDVRRAEKVVLAMKVRPTLRLYSREKIERQAGDYVQRNLAGATVRASPMGGIRVETVQALRPGFKNWLREQLMRDIPGIRAVAFDAASYSRTQELASDPFSILSIGSVRFLLATDGERIFPGAEVSKGLSLVRIGRESIFVERKGDD
ncbi:phosphopeptide-binding protein [Burkholderia territorii]|uniref:Phosphopeptide-binding protein n=1 Tax=Burkholderia territorii TaxID=1503055 RepID=A0A105V174_9BURK|nr:FHA domain-containing protein [Burkholderia territorii]KVV39196.1 phosphopeptide-binding protein [Burkholderia territorii]KVX26258.1 phosphopeptide-binding protein [Burkholderia territorii]